MHVPGDCCFRRMQSWWRFKNKFGYNNFQVLTVLKQEKIRSKFLCSLLWRLKPATHYSSVFANNDKIIFSRKNLNFAKLGENTPTHCSSLTAVFANMNISFRATKNRLWVSCRNCSIERRRRRMQNKKPVRETSAKMLYTLFAFHSFFIISLIFRYCSR